jgi:AcrR family transcriptional regulator
LPNVSKPIDEVPGRRRIAPEERRSAILSAALKVFTEQGFAAARLDDVAQAAGVAKGTLYLYFPDKETLFEQLLLGVAGPILERLEGLLADQHRPAPEILGEVLDFIQKEILSSPRTNVLRLMIAEGPRFPRIAEFYYRTIVCPGRELIRTVAQRGVQRGELTTDALTKFPQLFFAPILMAVVWQALFSEFDALDAQALLAEHRKLMFKVSGVAVHGGDS